MKKLHWRSLFLMVLLALLVMSAACSKKVMENQAATEPAVQPEPEPQVAEPAPEPVPVEAAPQDDGRDAFTATIIHFDFDSAALQPEAQELLRAKAQWLQGNSGMVTVRIEGHCDERGTEAYNLALGARRAEAVKQFMADMGIDATKLETTSYGEEKPLDSASNEAAWARNRRVAFGILP